jgi:hypothetical protein
LRKCFLSWAVLKIKVLPEIKCLAFDCSAYAIVFTILSFTYGAAGVNIAFMVKFEYFLYFCGEKAIVIPWLYFKTLNWMIFFKLVKPCA